MTGSPRRRSGAKEVTHERDSIAGPAGFACLRTRRSPAGFGSCRLPATTFPARGRTLAVSFAHGCVVAALFAVFHRGRKAALDSGPRIVSLQGHLLPHGEF